MEETDKTSTERPTSLRSEGQVRVGDPQSRFFPAHLGFLPDSRVALVKVDRTLVIHPGAHPLLPFSSNYEHRTAVTLFGDRPASLRNT